MPQSSRLKPKQRVALTALLTGQTVTQAAAAAGVDRTAVHRWLRSNDAFRAALDEAREDATAAGTLALTGLLEKSLDVVHGALDAGDVKVALAIVQASGILERLRPSRQLDDEADDEELVFELDVPRPPGTIAREG